MLGDAKSLKERDTKAKSSRGAAGLVLASIHAVGFSP
jgi:hypothetical protein